MTKDILCNRRSSWVTNPGETVDERIMDAPDGSAEVRPNNMSILTKNQTSIIMNKLPGIAPRSPYRTLSA